jgi:hypothetical protein
MQIPDRFRFAMMEVRAIRRIVDFTSSSRNEIVSSLISQSLDCEHVFFVPSELTLGISRALLCTAVLWRSNTESDHRGRVNLN